MTSWLEPIVVVSRMLPAYRTSLSLSHESICASAILHISTKVFSLSNKLLYHKKERLYEDEPPQFPVPVNSETKRIINETDLTCPYDIKDNI